MFFVLGVVLQSTAFAGTTPVLFLTAFEPFAGRAQNNSYLVAKEIKQQLESRKEGSWHVELCVLPVEYDRAAKVARDCYAKLGAAPAKILSLGEGFCDLRLEVMARNRDGSMLADNAGVDRSAGQSIVGGLPNLGLVADFDNMYCALNAGERAGLRLSNNAGNFVCNNTAFLLRNYFGADVRYNFMHVPNATDCSAAQRDPMRNAGLVIKMLLGQKDVPVHAFPTDAQEFAAYSGAFAAPSACQREFLVRAGKFF